MNKIHLVRKNAAPTHYGANDDAVFDIRGLTVAYGGAPVLYAIDARFLPGSLTAIIGPNGAGKSSLLKASLGLIPKLAGEVYAFGKPVAQSRGRIAYVPQRNQIDWDFPARVIDVVMMGLYPKMGLLRRIKKEDHALAAQALRDVGMQDFAHRQIGALSGGQQQRVFLARALAQNADILLLDEPFAGVDAATEKAIIDVLFNLRDAGKTLIAVHHDLGSVEDYFDNLLIINRQKVAQGAVSEVFCSAFLQQAYRGQLSSAQTGVQMENVLRNVP